MNLEIIDTAGIAYASIFLVCPAFSVAEVAVV
jgi:hypothetical protein